MAKLTTLERRRHDSAMDLLRDAVRRPDGSLSPGDRNQILSGFHPGSGRDTGRGGVFFTPQNLARDMMVEVAIPMPLPVHRSDSKPFRVVDVGAGIGCLSHALWMSAIPSSPFGVVEGIELICIEQDQELCEIGQALVPWATWINADAFERATWVDLGAFDAAGYRFDYLISNPPYGISARRPDPWLKSGKGHFAVAELASMFCRNATFIFPQGDLPFRFSGHQSYQAAEGSVAYQRWSAETQCQLGMNCGLDTSLYESEWVGVSPRVEVALLERRD